MVDGSTGLPTHAILRGAPDGAAAQGDVDGAVVLGETDEDGVVTLAQLNHERLLAIRQKAGADSAIIAERSTGRHLITPNI